MYLRVEFVATGTRYVTTKVEVKYSFAALQQDQPLLLRLRQVVNPPPAIATSTTRNLGMLKLAVTG